MYGQSVRCHHVVTPNPNLHVLYILQILGGQICTAESFSCLNHSLMQTPMMRLIDLNIGANIFVLNSNFLAKYCTQNINFTFYFVQDWKISALMSVSITHLSYSPNLLMKGFVPRFSCLAFKIIPNLL